jgi:hypothetical protein
MEEKVKNKVQTTLLVIHLTCFLLPAVAGKPLILQYFNKLRPLC